MRDEEFTEAELVNIADDYFQTGRSLCPRDSTRLQVDELTFIGRLTADLLARCPRCGMNGRFKGNEPDRSSDRWDWDPVGRAFLVDEYWRAGRAICPIDGSIVRVEKSQSMAAKTTLLVHCRRCGRNFLGDRVELADLSRDSFENRFTVIERLAEGGMGRVSLVKERSTGALYVAKEILPGKVDADGLARFRREIRLLAGLAHPNVVRFLADFVTVGRPILVMEFLPGGHLENLINDKGVPSERLVSLFKDAVSGVEHLHRNGIVHRDLKPRNILIGADNRARVSDLGLAHHPDESTLTVPGTVLGTRGYMAPEQKGGGVVTQKCDVFALGVIAFEIATRKSPYLTLRLQNGPFWDVLDRALEDKPERRTVTPRDLAEALRSYVATPAPAQSHVASDVVTEVINPGADFTRIGSVPMSGELDTHLVAHGYQRTGRRGRPSKGELYLGRGDGVERGIYRRERDSAPDGYSGADTFEILERV